MASTAVLESARTYLVADIGGTNARFAIANVTAATAGQGIQLQHQQIYQVKTHPSLTAALTHYIQALPVTRPRSAVLAVASAVTGNTVVFTKQLAFCG